MDFLEQIQNRWNKPGILLADNLPETYNFDEVDEDKRLIIEKILKHSEQQEIARLEQAQQVGDYPLCFFDEESSNAFRMKARLKKQRLSEYVLWALNLALDTLEIPKTPILFDINRPQDDLKIESDNLVVYSSYDVKFENELKDSIFAFVPPVIEGEFLCSLFIWNDVISLSVQGNDDFKLTLLDAWQEKLLNF
jgi:hypothetical protein